MLRLALLLLVPAVAWASHAAGARDGQSESRPVKEATVQLGYLELVTPDVDATCRALEATHGVTFGERVDALGGARTAELAGGGRIGVRAPLRATEEPVVRPYVRVADIAAAVEKARAAGCEIALPPMELPGQGTCAIYVLGGVEHGLWQD